MKSPWLQTSALLPLTVAGALIGVPWPAAAGDQPAIEPSHRITAKSGKVSLAKRDFSCAPSGAAERQPLGAVLAEPGAEGLYPNAVGLSAIVDLGEQGYAITVATRAFSAGLFKGGGDVMLAGLDRSFNPLWATVIGGPLTLEIDRTGRVVASTWVDVVTALSTTERRSIVQVGPVAVNRDPDGRFVIMGDTVNVSSGIIAQTKGGGARLPANLQSDLKGVMYFARLDDNGRASACSLPVRASQRPLVVKGVALDLPALDMPAQKSPFIPEGNLSIERIVPR